MLHIIHYDVAHCSVVCCLSVFSMMDTEMSVFMPLYTYTSFLHPISPSITKKGGVWFHLSPPYLPFYHQERWCLVSPFSTLSPLLSPRKVVSGFTFLHPISPSITKKGGVWFHLSPPYLPFYHQERWCLVSPFSTLSPLLSPRKVVSGFTSYTPCTTKKGGVWFHFLSPPDIPFYHQERWCLVSLPFSTLYPLYHQERRCLVSLPFSTLYPLYHQERWCLVSPFFA